MLLWSFQALIFILTHGCMVRERISAVSVFIIIESVLLFPTLILQDFWRTKLSSYQSGYRRSLFSRQYNLDFWSWNQCTRNTFESLQGDWGPRWTIWVWGWYSLWYNLKVKTLNALFKVFIILIIKQCLLYKIVHSAILIFTANWVQFIWLNSISYCMILLTLHQGYVFWGCGDD